MPLYTYRNPNNGKEIEVLQGMNDVHEYSEKGVKWERVWSIPYASIDTSINPESKSDFVNKTANKKGSFGNIQDLSRELSEKRKERYGSDPVANKYYDNYSAERNGVRHQNDPREKSKPTQNLKNIKKRKK